MAASVVKFISGLSCTSSWGRGGGGGYFGKLSEVVFY